MGCRLLNTNHSSLSFRSSNSLFPSPNRALFPPNSLSFPFRFKSPQGFNICCAQRVYKESLICPLKWWEGRGNDDISQIYDAWCEEFRKKCHSRKEMRSIFEVFKENYEYVRQHNKHSNTCSPVAAAEYYDTFKPLTIEKMQSREGRVINYINGDEFWDEKLAEDQRNNKLAVVVFTSECSQQCKLMRPTLDDLAEGMPEVTFLKVYMNWGKLKAVAEKWKVEAVPTFMFLKNGEVVDKFVGFATEEQLQRKIAKHATVAASP